MDQQASRLPTDPMSLPEEQRYSADVEIGRAKFYLSGFMADIGGRTVTGSAASSEAPPTLRAYMELLERAAVLDAEAARRARWELRDQTYVTVGNIPGPQVFPPDGDPSVRRRSKSNGVAVHEDWARASAAAIQELVERDRVLRAWGRQLGGAILDGATTFDWSQLAEFYQSRQVQFGETDGFGAVVGCFAFPLVPTAPMAYGFACRPHATQAAVAAEAECLQRMSFLWGEAIPEQAPEMAPTAEWHQEYYLTPQGVEDLKVWLEEVTSVVRQKTSPAVDLIGCIDITPTAWRDKVSIAKAYAPGLQTLSFGIDPLLGVHPIA